MMTVITAPPSHVPGGLGYFSTQAALYSHGGLDQSSHTALVCVFIDFDYTVIIYTCVFDIV